VCKNYIPGMIFLKLKISAPFVHKRLSNFLISKDFPPSILMFLIPTPWTWKQPDWSEFNMPYSKTQDEGALLFGYKNLSTIFMAYHTQLLHLHHFISTDQKYPRPSHWFAQDCCSTEGVLKEWRRNNIQASNLCRIACRVVFLHE
jgi:hypothetical protein